jgi:hypothetical protein
MGGLANMMENFMLNHVLKVYVYDIYDNIKIGLSTTDVGEDGSGISEPVGNGYSRVEHNLWTRSGSKSVSNNGNIVFPEATGSWGNVGYYFLTDSTDTTGNTIIGYGDITNPSDVNSGDTITFNSGQLKLWFYLNGASNFMSEKILDMTFLNGVYDATSDIYVGLSSVDPGSDGSGIVEPDSTATSYTRIVHNIWEKIDFIIDPDITIFWNLGTIAFPEASAAWGAPITHAFLIDDEDNLLFYGELISPVTIQQGDSPIFKNQAVTIRLE